MVENKKVLIVNCHANGYGVVSSLCNKRKDDYFIIVCDPNKNCASFKSKYVDRAVLVPQINTNEEEFLNTIISIGKEYDQKIYLIPTNDTYLIAFQRNWSRLQEYFIPVFELDADILKTCMDKKEMYVLAEKAGVPYPKSFYHSSEIRSDDVFPVIVKPLMKTADNFLKIPFRIKKFNSRKDLELGEKLFHNVDIDYVIQQYIPGNDDQLYTGGTVSISGKIYGIGTGRKIRQYPANLGICAYGELVKDEKLEYYTRKFVNHAKISGISQVEFKKYNGDYYLMEINPRPWLWNRLITFGGVNLPHIYIKALEKPDMSEVKQNKFEGYYSASINDLIYNVKNGDSVSFLSWLKQVLTADIYSLGSRKDPLPGLYNIINHIPIIRKFRK